MEPTTSVKTEVVEQRQPSLAERWETFRHKFSPIPGMPVQKLTLLSDPSQIRQTPIDYRVLRPTKLAEELGHKSKKKEGKMSKSRHRGKGAKHKKRGHRDPSSSSTSPSPRSAKKGEKLGKLGKSKHHDKKPRQKKRVESNSSSASSDEEEYQKGVLSLKRKRNIPALQAVLLTLPAQIQILMRRSVQSTGLIIGNLRKRAHLILRAPVLTLMMSSTFVQSTVLIIRSQRNEVEQHF